MKNILSVALVALILCAGMALAEAQGDFFVDNVTPGVAWDWDLTDGVLTFDIVTDGASDFAQAAMYAEEGFITAHYAVLAPDNAHYFIDFNGNGFSTDREFNEFFSGMENEDQYVSLEDYGIESGMEYAHSFGVTIGEYIAESNLVCLTPCDDNYSLVRWYDADHEPIRTDKVLVKVRFDTDEDAIALDRDILTEAEDIFLNTNGIPGLNGESTKGCADYTIDPDLIDREAGRFVETQVKAPDEAVRCFLETIMGSDENDAEPGIVDDCISIMTPFAEEFEGEEGPEMGILTDMNRNTYRITWYDEYDEVVSDRILIVNTHMADTDPWSCYVEDWSPVPTDRLVLNEDALGEACGFDYREDTGLLHFCFDPDAVTADELEGAREILSVRPPEGARSYRINHSGGSDFFGRDDFLAEEQDAVISMQKPQSIGASHPSARVYDRPLYRVIHKDDAFSLYQPVCETKPGFGSLYLIYWYANTKGTGEPICREYINENGDPMVHRDTVDPVMTEDELGTGEVDVAGLIYNGDREVRLQVDVFPQITTGCVCYELNLVTLDGKPVTPDALLTIYLPYPLGGCYGDLFKYYMRHYDSEYSRFDLEEVEKTPMGLRIQVHSLSPFVLGQAGEIDRLVLPSDLLSIGDGAFAGDTGIEYVVVPEGCASIGSGAFRGCTGLVRIDLPEGIDIADDAFEGCDAELVINYT